MESFVLPEFSEVIASSLPLSFTVAAFYISKASAEKGEETIQNAHTWLSPQNAINNFAAHNKIKLLINMII